MTCREIDAAQTTHESKTLVSKHVEFTVDIKPSSNHQSQQTSIDTPDDQHPRTQASETARHTYKLNLIHYFISN